MASTLANPARAATHPGRESPATVGVAFALLPIAAVFLGGATQRWSQGAIFCALGTLLVAAPPRRSLGWGFHALIIGLLGCAALSFLPAGCFFAESWRAALQDDFGLTLPATLTPQPWLTGESIAGLIAGMCWLYCVVAHDWPLRDARQQARVFAAGAVALAALCLLLHWKHAQPLFWHNERQFGPFPNRNQTGNFFGLSALIVFACAQEDFRRKHKRALFWALGLVAIGAVLILNFSRAGVLLFLAGISGWLLVQSLRNLSAARVAIACSVVLVLLAGLFVFGGETLARFHLHEANSAPVPRDFRWLIFHDTLALIRASPWCGLGLGNFNAVFAIFRDASRGDTRALHPESDWLWLAAELGPLAVALIFAGLARIGRLIFPLDEGSNQRLRLAALLAAALFLLHGFADVSGHRVGTAFAAIFLLGLAVRRPLTLPNSRLVPVGSRVLGIALIGLGLTWMIATWRAWPLPGAVGVANAKTAAAAANRQARFADTIALTTRALAWAPLDWELYFFRAIGEVGAHQPADRALADFRRARFLEPNAYEVPLEEGRVWLLTRPISTAIAWREALRRAGSERLALFDRMLSDASKSGEVTRALLEWSAGKPELALVVFGRASEAGFAAEMAVVLEHDPALRDWDAAHKAKLFALWGERGKLDDLAPLIEAHPEWREFAWRGLARFYAAHRDYRQAWELAERYAAPPAMPSIATAPLAQLQKQFHANPRNLEIGLALFQEQQRAGELDHALTIARHFTAEENCPAYFHFLEAQAWAAKGEWERAWAAWQKAQIR